TTKPALLTDKSTTKPALLTDKSTTKPALLTDKSTTKPALLTDKSTLASENRTKLNQGLTLWLRVSPCDNPQSQLPYILFPVRH
ncbi:hypothetical protein, partial [Coleofasciculus chthonoplastes]|uniref:hypothetical protein n=1 Tax=Coleofasciculus chthonoplastes TaxID=64178 RepID=UPI0032F57270